MENVILVIAALMLIRNGLAVRHYPSVPNILLLLFWMAVLAYSLVPAPAIFVLSSVLVVLALLSRIYPEKAQELGERWGLPAVGSLGDDESSES